MRQIAMQISVVVSGCIAIYAQVQARAWPTVFLSFLALVAAGAVSGHVNHSDADSPQPSLVHRGPALASARSRRAGHDRELGATAEQLLGVLEQHERLLGEWNALMADAQATTKERALRRSLEIAAQLNRLDSQLARILEDHPEYSAMLQAKDGRLGGPSGPA